MLYVDLDFGRTYSWHIGTPPPMRKPENVSCIQADGDELLRILALFGSTIPQSNRPVQAWYGDIAKTIAFALFS